MKKSIKTVILAIIFILSTALSTYAADYAGTAEVTLSPASISAKVGETVTITLSANCATGIEGIDSTLEYDKTKLELISEVGTNGFTSMSGEDLSTGEYKLSALYTNTTEAPTEANFATLTFEVLDTANVDETLSIKLTDIEIGDSNDDWITVGDGKVELTVVEDEELGTGEGEQAPGEDEEQQPGEDEEQQPGEDEEQQPGEDGEQQPGEDGEQQPGKDEEQQSSGENKKTDDTTAQKPINYAGLTDYAMIPALGIGILAIVFYAKYRKYRDVK